MQIDNQTVWILIVEDEPLVSEVLEQVLRREKYNVVAVSSPLEALGLVANREFAVIISDQRMPQMHGLDFLIETRKISPLSTRILISGVHDLKSMIGSINRGEIYRFITKPWLHEELIATVSNAIQKQQDAKEYAQLKKSYSELSSRLETSELTVKTATEGLRQKAEYLEKLQLEVLKRSQNPYELCFRLLTTYDPILGNNTKSIVKIAEAMGRTTKLSPDESRALVTSAWLCDLGLIGIPLENLRAYRRNQKELLCQQEINLIENHPLYSQTIASLIDTSQLVQTTIRAHHEAYDGLGFPDGQAGEWIPWTARLLAVAVGYIESGLPHAEALNQIEELSEKKYDPDAIALFKEIIAELILPAQIKEVLIEELAPQMVLFSDIHTAHGLLLVKKDEVLDELLVSKINEHNLEDKIKQRFLIYS